MNFFTLLLKILKVKHTAWYSQKRFAEHPNKYNLLGISSLLNDYAVPNAAVRLEDKNMERLNMPFVAQTITAFVIVTNYDDENIVFLWGNKKIKTTIHKFREMWTGVVLIAEPDENSIEPDYAKNHNRELMNKIRQYFAFAIPIIFLSRFFYSRIHHAESILLMLVNLIGIIVCLLLVSKQVSTSGNIVDKICSLFSKKDCNSILESDASKIWGMGWSEIGLSYFTSNILILVIFPRLIPYMLLVNTIAPAYSFWSIWYQAKVAKQWCPLCVAVQILLWCLFFVYLIFGFFNLSFFNLFSTFGFLFDIPLAGLIYVSPLIFINLYLSALTSSMKTPKLTYSINSMKSNRNVFFALLKEQVHFDAAVSDSHILFGNPDSEFHITILTNPHCPPCAKMHNKVANLVKEVKNDVCVQYVFSSFNNDLKASSYFLTYIYYTKGEQIENIFEKWFKSGKYSRKDFFAEYGFDSENFPEEIGEEVRCHDRWIEKTKLTETPTVLVNGYKLPNIYNFEDLRYVIE
jgi:uncharacterized membrane protein/thiol-disulfide isomerase/thioredoxin